MKKLEMTEEELNELASKLANELENYGDQASGELESLFIKVLELKPTWKSLLVQKYESILKNLN